MKIALCLSGLPRYHPVSTASWGRIIGKYNPDVYIHSWAEPHVAYDTANELRWTFHPASLLVEPFPTIDISGYPDRHWPCIDVYRSLSMWTSINKAHQLVKQSNVQYDVIIRGRMDFYVDNLIIDSFDGLTLPFDPDKDVLQFNYRGYQMCGYNDHFAYGPMHWMDVYAKTLEEIPILYSQEAVDYCPENFLAACLVKHRVPVKFQKMLHKIIR